jgi:hypothetical protein
MGLSFGLFRSQSSRPDDFSASTSHTTSFQRSNATVSSIKPLDVPQLSGTGLCSDHILLHTPSVSASFPKCPLAISGPVDTTRQPRNVVRYLIAVDTGLWEDDGLQQAGAVGGVLGIIGAEVPLSKLSPPGIVQLAPTRAPRPANYQCTGQIMTFRRSQNPLLSRIIIVCSPSAVFLSMGPLKQKPSLPSRLRPGRAGQSQGQGWAKGRCHGCRPWIPSCLDQDAVAGKDGPAVWG